jgi:50S ribosomal protein L16 3-hydroxylase
VPSNEAEAADFFGRFITLYRSAGAASARPIRPRIEIEWALEHGARLHRHPFTRLAWRKATRGARLYAAGEEFSLSAKDARTLAAASEIDGALYRRLSQPGRDTVFELLAAGHYRLPLDEEE